MLSALLSASQRVAQRAAPQGVRRMGGGYSPVPKADTSMDHVFGDSSYRLPFNVSGLGRSTPPRDDPCDRPSA